MPIALILDGLVAVLLVATIVYAWLLNRRLGGLRAHRDELQTTINQFTEATKRAEVSIQTLRAIAEQSAKALQGPVDRAQALRDELSFMIGRADDLAGRIGVSPSAPPLRAEAPRPKAADPRAAEPASRPAAAPAGQGAQTPRPSTGIPSSAKAAATAANIAPAPAPAQSAAPAVEEEAAGGRSKAERELLKALRELR
ncbi:MAG: hypothetical protein HYR63_25135 [Proteobacteria bacterium]|nr:hypothetical protein [Pseudomonadota bacterium]MBI3497214.1 hypothetical protein [Pseudomonadota bacterium]